MQAKDIRVFVPSKNFEQSKAFYVGLGFKMSPTSDVLCILEAGNCTFFLQDFYDEGLAKNLMLQLIVEDIDEAFTRISSLEGFDIRYEPISEERWGKVMYLWGPAGELWHITQLNN